MTHPRPRSPVRRSAHRVRKSIRRTWLRCLDLFGAAERTSYWERFDKDAFMAEGLRGSHRSRAAVTDFLAEVMGGRPFSFLDCGILSGVTIQELRGRGLNVRYTGIDISERALATCGARFPDATWRKMDVNALDFPAGSHDVVHIRAVLEHLPDYEQAVREARRCAREWVVLGLFLPLADADQPERVIKSRGVLYLNRYGRTRFVGLLKSLFAEIREQHVVDSTRPHQLFFCRVPSAP